jgi:hypothetical protein
MLEAPPCINVDFKSTVCAISLSRCGVGVVMLRFVSCAEKEKGGEGNSSVASRRERECCEQAQPLFADW